jgi:hypothetical protein
MISKAYDILRPSMKSIEQGGQINKMAVEQAKENKVQANVSPDIQLRNFIGIPQELRDKPIIYMKAHRGYFDRQHKGHVEAFLRRVADDDPRADEEAVYFDVTQTTQKELIETLRYFTEKAVIPEEQNLLPASGSENIVPPGFIAQIQYLPPLDENDKQIGSAFSAGIDKGNYKVVLPQLKELLIENGVLKPSEDKLGENTPKKDFISLKKADRTCNPSSFTKWTIFATPVKENPLKQFFFNTNRRRKTGIFIAENCQ